MVDAKQFEELLLQALETELGGVAIYEAAVRCAQNEDLREEWENYLDQTREHVRLVRTVCEEHNLDPETETKGRAVVRHIGQSLLEAIEMASKAKDPIAAELVAAECVVLAETKDHLNWELLTEVAKKRKDTDVKTLRRACGKIEEEEEEHLYHTVGWSRELWIESLGMPAVLPPPEEASDVKTAISAARAKKAREDML